MGAVNMETAPLTWAAFGGVHIHGPTPLEREWWSLMRDEQDAILYWAGCWKRRGVYLSWTWCNWHVGGENDHGGHPHPAVKTAAAKVERMLAPLAHEARIRIMQAMCDGPRSAGQLSQATGLKGGNLYYHLKELIHADYVTDQEAAYDLTPLGCQLLITVACIAQQVVADRGREGLLITSSTSANLRP